MSIYPRVEYQMTEADLETIFEAIKPVPMIMLQCGSPPSQQERANAAWAALGKKMGFDGDTVKPMPLKGNLFFTAVPTENETQRADRELRETRERINLKVAGIRQQIIDLENQLLILEKP